MTSINRSILNHFITTTPPGAVLTTMWLEQRGVSSKLAWWYVHSGWLERVGDKAYKRAGDQVQWYNALAALQTQLNLPIHIGAKTALQLLGKAHYIPMQGIKQVILFADPGTHIPSWLSNSTQWSVDFTIHKTALFKQQKSLLTIIDRPIDGINLKLSSPERAAMEMLKLVPNEQSFEEAFLLFENLAHLRPAVVESLLKQCNSIKVKRLFLYLAEKCQHEWFSALDINKIDLGHGKRMIGQGGAYIAKYQLSVPIIKEG